MNQVKYYNVKSINPCNGLPCTYLSVTGDRIRTVDGKQVYYYDHNHTACPIEKVEQIPEAYIAAEMAYFNKFGTAAE